MSPNPLAELLASVSDDTLVDLLTTSAVLTALGTVRSESPLLTEYPSLERLIWADDRRLILLSVAGVGLAFGSIVHRLPAERFDSLHVRLETGLDNYHLWAKRGFGKGALSDYLNFIRTWAPLKGVPAETLGGVWVIWHLKNDTPTPDEWAIGNVLGSSLCKMTLMLTIEKLKLLTSPR